MEQLKGITPFQTKALEQINSTFSQSQTVMIRTIRKSDFGKEIFLDIRAIHVWIAPDEILIWGRNIDIRFEKYAYKSGDELLEDVTSYIKKYFLYEEK